MHVRNFELQKMYLFHPYFQAVQQRIEAFETEEKANREALEQVQAEKESLHKELSENKDQVLQVKIEMGQASEKLYAVEEKYKGIGILISNIDYNKNQSIQVISIKTF